MTVYPGGIAVTVLRAGARNRDGDRLPQSRHTVTDVLVDWGSSAGGGVDGVSAASAEQNAISLYCPPGSDIGRGDQVRLAGATFRVVGVPAPWVFAFSGRPAGLVVRLEEVTASDVDSES